MTVPIARPTQPLRHWLYQTVSNDSTLQDFWGTRFYQGERLLEVPLTKPFGVYRMGNDTDEGLSEDRSEFAPHTQFAQIFVHDEGGDYGTIDDIVDRLKVLLDGAGPSKEHQLICCRHLETSRDLDDDQMGTILRYARFLLVAAA